MKSSTNTRNIIIVMLCLTIICMGIGFSYLAIKLDTMTKASKIFDVSFTKVIAKTPVKGGLVSPTGTSEIINEGKTLNLNFNLYAPQDELSYTIHIKNVGNLPAKIVDIITYPNYTKDTKIASTIAPIKITHNDLTNRTLEPEEEFEITLVVSYQPTANAGQVTIPYQMTLVTSSIE